MLSQFFALLDTIFDNLAVDPVPSCLSLLKNSVSRILWRDVIPVKWEIKGTWHFYRSQCVSVALSFSGKKDEKKISIGFSLSLSLFATPCGLDAWFKKALVLYGKLKNGSLEGQSTLQAVMILWTCTVSFSDPCVVILKMVWLITVWETCAFDEE